MGDPDSSAARRYGVAAGCALVAVGLRRLLDPILGSAFPFATLFFAVLVAAGYGGAGPALLATATGGLASVELLLPPRGTFGVVGTENQAGLLLYFAVSIGIAVIGHGLREARRRAEQSRAEAAAQGQRLRVTLQSIGDAVIATDPRGIVASLNPVAAQLTGWPVEEAVGRPLEDVFRIRDERTRRPVPNPVDRALAEGRVVGLANHTVLVARDGTERPIDDSAAPIRDAGGALIGVVLVFRDVAERRRAERELERREQELSDFFEHATVGLHWLGPDGTILRVNQAELDLLGYEREEYVGRHVAEFHVDREVIDDILARLGAGETLRDRPARLRCKDGTIRHVVIGSSVLWDGERFVHTRCFTLDVTDRMRAQEAQSLLAAVVESSEDAIVTKTLDGVITSWNAGAERLFGHSAAEAIGQPITLIIPPDRRAEEQVIIERLRAGERIDHFETVRVAKSGRPVDISLTISPLRGPDGRIVGASKVARDVTARRQAEERLRTLAAVVEQSNDFVGISTPDMRPLFVNEAGRRMVGLASPEEVSRTSVLDYFHPDDRPLVEAVAVPALLRDGCWSGEVRFRHFRTGKPIHTMWNVTAIRDDDGRPIAWATVSPNLDALKAAEASVRESEERLRTLADNVAQFAWMADAGGGIVWYNKRWFDYTGTTLEEAQGWGWTAVLHPDHVERVVARIRHSWDTGEVWEDTFPMRARDGTYRWFLSRAIPIRDAEGMVLRWFGTNTDVTEQRQAEEALKQADRRKDEFLATLAHELRNPLSPVRNSLEIMKRSDGDRELLERARATIDRQVTHLERLVDDLLDVSRITCDKLELRRQRLDIATVVAQALETCRPAMEACRHTLHVDLPSEPLHVDADPVRLEQVLANLLSNAAKYTDPGGQIRLSVRRDGDHVLASVRDTGIGIPRDMLAQVFEMFTQVPGTGTRIHAGLGIGLTLVRRLVAMHGGTVEARSDGPGRGSEFVVRLPIAPDTAATAAAAPSDGTRPAGRRRVLVVDDNRDASESLAYLLDMMGHHTRLAYDGLEAVEAALAFEPDVVLLDIGLPKLNGFEVAQRLREQVRGKPPVLIALTGWGQEADRRRSREGGFDHHLVKPVDPDTILALLARLPRP